MNTGKLTGLFYAVDAVLITSSECELQALVTIIKIGCESNDLSLNVEVEDVEKCIVNGKRKNGN